MDDTNRPPLTTTRLSPAAYAVVKAAHEADYASRPGIAAALRAAVEQVEHCRDVADQADRLLDIAAELEA